MTLKDPDGADILRHWNRLQKFPGGKFLFNQLLGLAIPYTGSIRPRVIQLTPGHAIVEIRDRRRIRNHLRSVHAIALANLAELSTGLATLSGMPETARGILTGLEITYTKKSRGVITGECHCVIPESDDRQEYVVETTLTDVAGDVVATGKARWLIGPKKETNTAVQPS